ncbi:MAG: serine hydrolase [Nitrospirota bacterium]|nr:serine hydrolase [Nitrospirota bacterium]
MEIVIEMNRPGYRQVVLYLVVGSLLFAAGWLTHWVYQGRLFRQPDRRAVLKGFRFTSPLLDVELPERMTVGNEHIPFSFKVEAFVKAQIKDGRARDIAVYYRDLHDGPWFTIDKNTEYNPASMMKVPLMIAWLKRAEADRQELKRTFLYDGKKDMSAMQNIQPTHTLIPGRRYTVGELLDFMMRYSDNNATAILYQEMDTKELIAVMDGMDVSNHPDEENNFVTAYEYSGFFRILYNASFLNREMSEKALELLSHQDFPLGIAGGVPQGIVIASKFGEHAGGLNQEQKQLHEFGIVYHPEHPYILGVMTRGNDFGRQAEVIRDISRLIYTEHANATVGSGH